MVLPRSALFLVLALAAGAAAWSGCDGGSPLDEPTCGDVAGTYDFAAFVFDPDASFFPDINILDTLDTGETQLRLVNSCEFVFSYAYKGATTSLVTGTFDVTRDEVRLEARESDAADLQQIYLNRLITFRRQTEDDLIAAERQTVDLTTISDEFEGVPPVQGTIRLHLIRP